VSCLLLLECEDCSKLKFVFNMSAHGCTKQGLPVAAARSGLTFGAPAVRDSGACACCCKFLQLSVLTDSLVLLRRSLLPTVSGAI
jgi:hypothetical protein